MATIDTFLTQWKDSNRPYIISRGDVISYASANLHAAHIGECFLREGMSYQNIGFLMDNSAEYILTYFANRLIQSTNISINTKLAMNEIAAEIRYCDCNWVVAQHKYLDICRYLIAQLGVGVIEIENDFSLSILARPVRQAKRQNSVDIVVMLHTSGTTGSCKKVMLSEANLLANTHSHITSLKLTAEDITLIALPMSFVMCHTAQLLTHTRLGGAIVLYDQLLFSAKRFCELVQEHRITCFSAVPTLLTILDRYHYLHNYNLSSLHYICVGGAPMPSDVSKHLMQKMPTANLVHTYGLTECSPRVTALLPEDSMRKIGSIGKAIPGVSVEIVNEQGYLVNVGEVGEIRVAGENITPGYYKRVAQTALIKREGFIYTGDLAFKDEDGYIYLVGRKKNIIISGGINIYPEEVEQALLSLPFINDVIVFGEDDRIWGEIVVARIVPQEDVSVTLQMVHEGLAGNLAQFKWPKRIYLSRELMKTDTGKNLRL